MGRKRLIETDEERRLRLRSAYNRWVAKPENRLAKQASDKRLRMADPEKSKERHRKWRQANKDKTRLKSANERAVRLQRLPAWADRTLIKEFYLNCPEGYHVDHIIPLRGKLVSGLHTIENLQYLPAKENISKGNKFALAA